MSFIGFLILGLIAGKTMLNKETNPQQKLRWLVIGGIVLLAAGWALGALGICPVVKRIWTPSWALFSGGWCFLLLAAFYVVVDVANLQRWSLPLRVVGMNSIAAYCLAHLIEEFLRRALETHLGPKFFERFGGAYAPFFEGAVVLFFLWLILYWMFQRKLFLRI